MAKSFYGIMRQAARSAERSYKRSLREHERAVRQAESQRKAQEREYLRRTKVADKEARLAYLRSREAQVSEMNEDLSRRVKELRSLLSLSPKSARPFDFVSLKKKYVPQTLDVSSVIGRKPEELRRESFVTPVLRPNLVARLLGGKAKYEAAVREAEENDTRRYEASVAEYRDNLADWCLREERERLRFEEAESARKKEVEEQNSAVDEFEQGYKGGLAQSVIEYFSLILDRSELPLDFPEGFRLAYVPESRQVVVEHLLPTLDIVPSVAEYSYVKAKDEIREKPRKKAEIKDLYETVIASTSLRIINEIFSSDAELVVASLVLNGIVDTVNPATGESIRPCIVSVRASKDEFSKIVLSRIDPVACLRNLGSVSKKPDELAPVRPIIEFDMADPRFVKELDILSGLESRPNIMELTPFEFEGLVTNLFSSMGLDTKQTRSSRDGGVDAVAFDQRPVLGGKVVIQAKRYKNTVGVAAVRDLYGTMMNEGANKGILVTTAGFGPDAFEFARDKPIELIDGSGLLYLLEQQNVEARIIMPP